MDRNILNIKFCLSKMMVTFEAELIKKLSNAEAELKKSIA